MMKHEVTGKSLLLQMGRLVQGTLKVASTQELSLSIENISFIVPGHVRYSSQRNEAFGFLSDYVLLTSCLIVLEHLNV